MDEFSGEDLRNFLEEISSMHMPFGKYGKKEYPPDGYPLYDLPVEYLTWFKMQGFPRGRLGILMEQVWELKANGMDSLFDPLRKAAGGRTRWKPKHPKKWDFE